MVYFFVSPSAFVYLYWQKGIDVPPRGYRYLIQGFAYAGRFDKAKELFEQWQQIPRLGKDSAIYCGMALAYTVNGEV